MNIGSLSMKATLLSACIFWLIILSFEGFNMDASPFLLLSLIPIFICCLLTIIFTIAPIFWLENSSKNYISIYKKYFPFYTIVCFAFCIGFIIKFRFDEFALAFFTAAYFTLLQTWVWILKSKKA